MSIIAHARLTILSHKCLSMAARRYESGYIQNNHQTYQTLNQHKQTLTNLSFSEPQANRFLSVENQLLVEARKLTTCHGTPTPCQRRNLVLDRILVKELIGGSDYTDMTLLIAKNTTQPFNYSKDYDLQWTKFNNNNNNTTSINTAYESTNYLFDTVRKRSFATQQKRNPVSATAIDTNPNHKWLFKLRNKSHSDNRHDNHREDFKRRRTHKSSLFPMFGLLGLFRSMNAGDIEEEKAKLTDEQRMKKMTPGEIYIAKGVLSMCDQEYNKASNFFHKALDYAQEQNDEDQETLVLNLLASNYFESGDLENAEKLFIDLMKRMIAHDVEPTDLAILELSLKLASIYSKNSKTQDKALKGFKFVISTLLNNLQDILSDAGDLEVDQEISDDRKDELALLGWSYDWFAKHLINVDDFGGAAIMLRKALKISSRVLGPLHDQTLILLNDVGTTMAMNNSPEEGKDYMKKAVEGAIESQSKELASFYVNLGLVNLKLRQLDEAKRYCEYSIELALKNPEHHNSGDVIKLSQSCLNEMERLSGGQ